MKILVPIDGSKSSKASLKEASSLGEKLQAELIILTVIPETSIFEQYPTNFAYALEVDKANTERAQHILKEAEKDLKDPMRYLLYKETINQVYKDFKDSTDDKYNTYLILKLLEYQCDLAGDLIERYSDAEKAEIASSLLDNVCDILYRSLEEVPDEAYISIEESKHLLIYTLFRIHELPSMQKRFDSKI